MHVLKVIELMGSSTKSWEDAAATVVAEASKTLKGISSIYIKEHSCTVKDGKIEEYRITAKLSFRIEH